MVGTARCAFAHPTNSSQAARGLPQFPRALEFLARLVQHEQRSLGDAEIGSVQLHLAAFDGLAHERERHQVLQAAEHRGLFDALDELRHGLVVALLHHFAGLDEHLHPFADEVAGRQRLDLVDESADAAALYADALMVQHPWDLYDRYYNPKPWTPEIVKVLESLIKQFPTNPGANHYYIHAIEGSAHPERGLEVADRLGKMMPSVAHLVHMPSHIYIRTGYYDKGVQSNINAVKGYYNYRAKFDAVKNNGTFLYLVHNLHLQSACAQMDARYAESMKFSVESRNSFDSSWMDNNDYWSMYSQYVYMAPFFTQIRFGKWDDILNAPKIPASRVYASAMSHFARGLAFARKHNFNEANTELNHMKDSAQSAQLQQSPAAFNPGITAVNLAEKILQGVIAEEKEQYAQSITIFKEAVDMEDVMLYNEPKDWILPVRHYLGNALLKARQYKDAEVVYKEDLKINPNNAWALTGLKNALAMQEKENENKKIESQLKTALERSDVTIHYSVF